MFRKNFPSLFVLTLIVGSGILFGFRVPLVDHLERAESFSPVLAPEDDLIITGILDGPLTGGLPKLIELYAVNDIPNMGLYAIGAANNGGGSDGPEGVLSGIDTVRSGEFFYAFSDTTGIPSFLGSDFLLQNIGRVNFVGGAAGINGDDAVELFYDATGLFSGGESVIDVFGDINVDGTGQPWEYIDGWAYRVNETGPDGSTFVLGNWFFSGPNALDNETTNAGASNPFPIGTYQPGTSTSPTSALISEFEPNPDGADPVNVSVELSGNPGESFSGWLVSIESDGPNGLVDRATEVNGTFDSNGLLVVSIPDLENPSFTFALTSEFNGAVGTTDIDGNNDGVADDLSAFGTIFDAIGVPDAAGDTSNVYGADMGGIDFAFTGAEPELIFRDASVGDLYAVNVVFGAGGEAVFDVNGIDVTAAVFDTDPTTGATFGSINPSVASLPVTVLGISPIDSVKAEGDSGSTIFTFSIVRSGSFIGTTSVDFAVSGTADASDFGGTLPSGTVNFLSTDTLKLINITVSGDTDFEPDEDFTVTLSNPTNGATLSTASSADATIQNDDISAPVSALISEFEPNPDGTDPANVSVELSGNPGESFSGWLVSIESDGPNGLVDRATEVNGTFDSNGLLVVSIPDLENPSFTFALTSEFNGSVGTTDIDGNNDGVADDLSAFGTIFDAIGVPDAAGDTSNVYGADMGGIDFAFTGAEPELIFRDASVGELYAVNIVSVTGGEAVFNVNGIDVTAAVFDTDPTTGATFGSINPTTAVTNIPTLISEFEPNPDGTDPANVSVELSGNPGESFSGWLVSIESDGPNGLVDRATEVNGTFDSNGLLVVSIPDLENPSFTFALTSEFNGAVGATDIDGNNDGVADDLSAFGTIFDAIGVPDAAGDTSNVYGADMGGIDFAFTGAEPELIFRDASVGDLYAVNVVSGAGGEAVFDVNGIDVTAAIFDTDPTTGASFGSINPSVTGGADNTPPTLTALDPDNGATGVALDANLVATFSEAIQAGTGFVELLIFPAGPDEETFDVASSGQITISGSTLTINPTSDLSPNTTYHVNIASTAIQDLAGNAFVGIGDNSTWSFTTGDGSTPTVGSCPFTESFESAPGTTYTLSDPFTSGFDYFNRFAVPDNSNGARDDFQSGWTGSFGIQSQDNDGQGGSATRTVTIGPIDISTASTNVGIKLALGALASEPAFNNYEGNDGIEIYATVDNGTRTLIGSFAPLATASDLYLDTDLDGTGDGVKLTTTLTDFQFFAPSTGAVLLVEIELTSNNGFEPLVLDNVRIECDPSIPTAVDAKINEVQGSGSSVTNPGTLVAVEGIVIGDYQGANELQGFFIQEEDTDADGNSNTSEGIFVFCGFCNVAVSEGQKVLVTGIQEESANLSRINVAIQSGEVAVTDTADNSGLVSPTVIDLPASANTFDIATFENVEGMLVEFSDKLTVTEYFQLGRFGQIVLSEGGKLRQFTNDNMPDAAGFIAAQDATAKRRIILDDLNNVQNDDPVYHPQPGGFAVDNYIRGGYTVSNLTGVMDWASPGSGDATWRIRPQVDKPVSFSAENPRTAAPVDVGGRLKVASFNVLNYFTTIDVTASNNVGDCGPNGTEDCRGADSQAELVRQTDKIVAALKAIDADVVGLIELENNAAAAPANDGTDPVLEYLVNALNAEMGAGTYDFVDAGIVGTDVIKVAFIYKPGTVNLSGNAAILDAASFVDPNNIGPKNRAALAQTFEEISTGEKFTAVVNHLKSKGSGCGSGDDDTTTGQGNCNDTRTKAAAALADWLATDPTGSSDSDFLIIGDLNAYAMEDPIVALKQGSDDKLNTDDDFTDLVHQFLGENAYTFVFDGQYGYLDHALANTDMFSQVTGTTIWTINSDEVNLLDYNDTVDDPGEEFFEAKPLGNVLYDGTNPGPYRSSDHDPVIVGLSLGSDPVCEQINLALGKSSKTTCDYGNSSADLGVDGETFGETPWHNPDIVHTCTEAVNPWWEVDLRSESSSDETFKISKICLFNRANVGPSIVDRLSNYYLLISCDPFDEGASLNELLGNQNIFNKFIAETAGYPSCIEIPDVTGRYVRIQKADNRPLHFAELQVFGCPAEGDCGPIGEPCNLVESPMIESVGPFFTTDTPKQLIATPAGGVWSGDVSATGVFDPSVGAGFYQAIYTVTTGDSLNGICEKVASLDIEVREPSTDDCLVAVNLALGKPAMQSSIYGNGIPEIAVDGDIDGSRGPWAFPSIQHTQTEAQPWWMVDLEELGNIEYVEIFNRTDCCVNRLKDFYVFVSRYPIDADKTIDELKSDSNIQHAYFDGPAGPVEQVGMDFEGRYVVVKLVGKGPLHMAEVKVMGCPAGPAPECDLVIEDLVLVPPSSCDASDGSIEVITSRSDALYSIDNGETFLESPVFNFLPPYRDTLIIFLPAQSQCVVKQAIVLDTEEGCGLDPCDTPENLALRKASEQSSTYGNGVASIAVDGDTDGSRGPWSNPSIQHTKQEAMPWWSVNLGSIANIESVKLFNRTDCCVDRLKNFYVFVSNLPIDGRKSISELTSDTNIVHQYFPGVAAPMESFAFTQTTGQYVMVKLAGSGILHMAEVQVLGCGVSTPDPTRFANANSTIDAEPGLSMEAYPNPFTNSFTLQVRGEVLDEAKVELVNALGQRVEVRSVIGEGTITMGRNLSKGIYFLHLMNGTDVKQLKVVKAK